MSRPYSAIHSAVVLVIGGVQDDPIRVTGYSDWDQPPTTEEYERSLLASLVTRDLPHLEGQPVRVIELNFSVVELPEAEL